jgi:hypothetical protein
MTKPFPQRLKPLGEDATYVGPKGPTPKKWGDSERNRGWSPRKSMSDVKVRPLVAAQTMQKLRSRDGAWPDAGGASTDCWGSEL